MTGSAAIAIPFSAAPSGNSASRHLALVVAFALFKVLFFLACVFPLYSFLNKVMAAWQKKLGGWFVSGC
jgi:hypothetical protein